MISALVLATSAPALAQSVSLGPSHVRVQIGAETREVDVGCPPWAIVTVGNRTYVAAGACGVATIEVAGNTVNIVEQRRLAGEATAIAREGDTIVVTTRAANGAETRQVVANLGPAPAPAPAPVPPPTNGEALPPPPPPPTASTAPPAPAPVAYPVTNAEPPVDRAREEARERRRAIIAPPRRDNSVSISADAFVFLPIDALGIGAIMRAMVEYHAPIPMFFRGEVLPLGLSSSNRPGDPTVFLAQFVLGLDTQLFGVGVGVGGQTVNDTQFDPDPSGPQRDAFIITSVIRGGATDGLHGEIRGGLYVGRDRFQLGFIDGRVMIPLTAELALFFHGAGGSDGHAMGEGGVRLWVVGLGEPGSVALRITAGGGYLFAVGSDPDVFCPGCGFSKTELSGPGFGLGFEWRP